MSDEWLQELVTTLDPQHTPGRLTLIHRFGAKDIEKQLPRAIEAVRRTGHTVLWCCDPMHGNTETSVGGLKTRRFENILREVDLSFRIHRELGSWLGGVHIELTGEDVTGAPAARVATGAICSRPPFAVDAAQYEQALELAMLIAERSRQRSDRDAATTRRSARERHSSSIEAAARGPAAAPGGAARRCREQPTSARP
jgi:3-deoxy-7-phosphoheptulonate synthase